MDTTKSKNDRGDLAVPATPLKIITHEKEWYGWERIVIMSQHGDGCVIVEREKMDGEQPFIYNLSVKPDARGRGIASAMMDAAEQWCRERGYSSCRLRWDKRESESWTLDWYISRGYEEKSSVAILHCWRNSYKVRRKDKVQV